MEWFNKSIDWVQDHTWDLVVYMVTQETGILIGLALLIVASGYLPKKVRLHVLTGGISIALYQIGKNYYFRQKWKEAEDERIRLKEEKKALEAQGKEMLNELEQLRQRSDALHEEIAAVKQEKEALRASDDFQADAFDERIDTLRRESEDVNTLIDELPVITRRIGETTQQLDAAVR
jgi:prefoldin subunit 5